MEPLHLRVLLVGWIVHLTILTGNILRLNHRLLQNIIDADPLFIFYQWVSLLENDGWQSL
jgi:hypothetical protein